MRQKGVSKLSDDSSKSKNSLWDWVKAISTLVVVGVVSYKVYLTPINLTVDFPTLLSLLLALFSVGLAALFYFKATDTSNTFYDNTYNFTKDIAQLLVKMESGFGERLRNLDEGYSSMRQSLQHYNEKPSAKVEETKKKIKTEKTEMDKVVQERNQIIEKLIERANLQEEEKSSITEQLKEKETELSEAQKELSRMNKRLFMERMDRKRSKNLSLDFESGVIDFTRSHVVRKLGAERILEAPRSYITKKFESLLNELPRQYFEDLEREGLFDNGLTPRGYRLLVNLAGQEIGA
jgi:DNA-binding ferritin-like protein